MQIETFKRSHYISQLLKAGIREVDGKLLHDLKDKELLNALAIHRAKTS